MANVIDLKDVQGDRKAGIQTLPTVLGYAVARKLIGGFLLIVYLWAGMLFREWPFLFLAVGCGVIQFRLVACGRFDERRVFLVYLASLLIMITGWATGYLTLR